VDSKKLGGAALVISFAIGTILAIFEVQAWTMASWLAWSLVIALLATGGIAGLILLNELRKVGSIAARRFEVRWPVVRLGAPDETPSEMPSSATSNDRQQATPSGIEFYPDRPSLVKARGGLKKELESVYVAWAAWYAGTHAAAEEVFESTHKPQKLILLNPDGKYAPIVGDLFRRPLEQLRRDIETTRDKALAAGIKTYLFDGPMELMVIGEPESGNGWVRVEIAIPGSAVRPNIVIRQTDYPELFQQFVQAYKTMLSHHETVSFVGQ